MKSVIFICLGACLALPAFGHADQLDQAVETLKSIRSAVFCGTSENINRDILEIDRRVEGPYRAVIAQIQPTVIRGEVCVLITKRFN